MEKKTIQDSISSIDILILLLVLGITFIDTINGFLLKNDLLSISKPYKFIILSLMALKLVLTLKVSKYFILVIICFTSFFTGYFYYFLQNYDITLFVQNFIESTKYFIWPISFIYFRRLYLKSEEKGLKIALQIINISYLVLLFNIFLGLLGLGYKFYQFYNTGLKGFFFSGNEFSLLFILLTWVKAWQIKIQDVKKYYFFILFSLFLAFNIGSKTTILGVLGIFFIIQFSNITVDFGKIQLKKIIFGLIGVLISPLIIMGFVIGNKSYFDDFILKRLEIYNYDLLTWFLSKRNLVARDSLKEFKGLDLMSKYFGQGEISFQQNTHIVELDFVDLMLNHGYVGLFFYCSIILIFLLMLKTRFSQTPLNKCLFYFYLIIILFLSNLSGHIINTGVPGFFIGMIFAITFIPIGALKKTKLI
ncbi:O-antigen ligase family protein [Maribacter luteus]|uniref:O-antigen ligase family protein n=1 Tax=Maribacter luteus TaxID=2594478 RepID=UPI002491BB5C|nr:O-antigen ligase family protein [Maribacter luteus]